MQSNEAIQQLEAKIPNVLEAKNHFHGQVSLQVRKNHLKEVLSFLKETGFKVLTDLTGVDEEHPVKSTRVIYFLQNPQNFERIRLCVLVAREDSLASITDLWKGASWYERELYDLFGVLFVGHLELKRILMPDDWQGHPLRKDYALTEVPVQFKHDVNPKVPSEIIPHVKNKK